MSFDQLLVTSLDSSSFEVDNRAPPLTALVKVIYADYVISPQSDFKQLP